MQELYTQPTAIMIQGPYVPYSYRQACVKHGWPIIFYKPKKRYATVEMDLLYIKDDDNIASSREFYNKVLDIFLAHGIARNHPRKIGVHIRTEHCPIEQAENVARDLLALYKETFEKES